MLSIFEPKNITQQDTKDENYIIKIKKDYDFDIQGQGCSVQISEYVMILDFMIKLSTAILATSSFQ